MAVDERARNHLFKTLREAHGEEDAATMMELLPPVGWADVARQRDVDALREQMVLRFDALEQRFATKDDLRDQTNRYIGWMVATNATLVATVTLITALR
jgi:hypothetical protein